MSSAIARPYARAAFEYAMEKNALPAWQAMLDAAAVTAEDARVIQMLSNSEKFSNTQMADFFCEILQPLLNVEMKNFIRLLASYKRLPALPDIAKAFKQQCDQKNRTIAGEVVSASALNEDELQKIAKALTQRLKLTVTLINKIDAKLLGGAIIRVGSMVIDGSVLGKLRRMMNFI